MKNYATLNSQAAYTGVEIGSSLAVAQSVQVSPNTLVGSLEQSILNVATLIESTGSVAGQVGLALSVGIPEIFGTVVGLSNTAQLLHEGSVLSGAIASMNAQTAQGLQAYSQYSGDVTSYASQLGNAASSQAVGSSGFPWIWLIFGAGAFFLYRRHKKSTQST